MRRPEKLNEKAFQYYASLKKLREHFEDHYAQPTSLSDAAQLVGLEPKHFSKFFRRKVGMGFKQWLTKLRVRKAMEFIQTGDQTLTEIALNVGFQNLRTFERAFKRQTGLTPREFRAEVIAQVEIIA